VRRGVLFALSKIVQVFPPYMLMEDFTDKLDEIQMWLYGKKRGSKERREERRLIYIFSNCKYRYG